MIATLDSRQLGGVGVGGTFGRLKMCAFDKRWTLKCCFGNVYFMFAIWKG